MNKVSKQADFTLETMQTRKLWNKFFKIQAHVILLHYAFFTVLCRYHSLFIYKLKICGNPELSKSISAIFQTLFAHFLSWCLFPAKTDTLTLSRIYKMKIRYTVPLQIEG